MTDDYYMFVNGRWVQHFCKWKQAVFLYSKTAQYLEIGDNFKILDNGRWPQEQSQCKTNSFLENQRQPLCDL